MYIRNFEFKKSKNNNSTVKNVNVEKSNSLTNSVQKKISEECSRSISKAKKTSARTSKSKPDTSNLKEQKYNFKTDKNSIFVKNMTSNFYFEPITEEKNYCSN